MKLRALNVLSAFYFFLPRVILAYVPPNVTDAVVPTFTLPGAPSTFDPDYFDQKFDDFSKTLTQELRSMANGITRDVLDQVAYYVPAVVSIGTGLGLFAYAVARKDSGCNKKTIALWGTSAVLMTLGSLMVANPEWFNNEGHNH